MTITEALAEIKTLRKRIDTAHANIQANLFRDSRRVDPLEKQGGSSQYVAQEMQSFRDLCNRIVALRTAIAAANEKATLTVVGRSMTVAQWLIWRREVLPLLKNSTKTCVEYIRQQRAAMANTIRRNATETITDLDIIVHVDEKALMKEMDDLNTIEGTLDGLLSMHNARTEV